MPPFPDSIRAFYEQFDESARLQQGFFRLEKARTQIILERFLPPPPATILDIGSGPGVYARWLAGAGYRVCVLDPVPRHIERAISGTAELAGSLTGLIGEAQALPFADRCADALLLLGPLYHLPSLDERITTLRECRRVLKSGGLLFAALISRYASALDGLRAALLLDPAFRDIVQADLATGCHRNTTGKLEYFTEAYFHEPAEVPSELVEAGLIHLQSLAIEGPAWLLPNFAEWWEEPARRLLLLELTARLEAVPSLLGASAHFMAISRTP